jgi:hypothetical protein
MKYLKLRKLLRDSAPSMSEYREPFIKRVNFLLNERRRLREHWLTIEDVNKFTEYRKKNQIALKDLLEFMQKDPNTFGTNIGYCVSPIAWIEQELNHKYEERQ